MLRPFVAPSELEVFAVQPIDPGWTKVCDGGCGLRQHRFASCAQPKGKGRHVRMGSSLDRVPEFANVCIDVSTVCEPRSILFPTDLARLPTRKFDVGLGGVLDERAHVIWEPDDTANPASYVKQRARRFKFQKSCRQPSACQYRIRRIG